MKSNQDIQIEVQRILKINAQEYDMNILDYSFDYLEKKGFLEITPVLHSMRGYWIWWRNQFIICDAMFLNHYKAFNWQRYGCERLNAIYYQIHVGIKAYPSRIIEKIDNEIKRKKGLTRKTSALAR